MINIAKNYVNNIYKWHYKLYDDLLTVHLMHMHYFKQFFEKERKISFQELVLLRMRSSTLCVMI